MARATRDSALEPLRHAGRVLLHLHHPAVQRARTINHAFHPRISRYAFGHSMHPRQELAYFIIHSLQLVVVRSERQNSTARDDDERSAFFGLGLQLGDKYHNNDINHCLQENVTISYEAFGRSDTNSTL